MRMVGEPTCAFSTVEFAREFGWSRNHLTKVMQRLAEGGAVETRRGGAPQSASWPISTAEHLPT